MAEQVRAWRPAVPGITEVFHAHFTQHAYPRHTHDAWTLITVTRGDIRFTLEGHPHGSSPSTLTLLPPHIAHDGRAGPSGGFSKRVVYLDTSILQEDLIGHAVDRPGTRDRRLLRAVERLHRGLAQPEDPLLAELAVVEVGERVRRLLRATTAVAAPQAPGAAEALAEAARAALDAHLVEGITMRQVAARLHASPGHVARTFSATFGISPHAYVLGRRIGRARALLLEGWPPAQVAAALGFVDQAHLSRHFRRHVGTTPARFARLG